MSASQEIASEGIGWNLYEGAKNGDAAGRPPLVILHGLLGSGDNWQSQAAEFARDGWTVLVADLPNHGVSAHVGPAEMTFPAMAAYLWRSLDALASRAGSPLTTGEPISILGHSLGGKIAMAMALDRPGGVDRLVVADIAPMRYPHRHDEILEAMDLVAQTRVASRSEAESIMASLIPERAVRLFLLKSLRRGGNSAGSADGAPFEWVLNLAAIREAYPVLIDWPWHTDEEASRRGSADGEAPDGPRVEVPRWDGPVTVIAGGRSPYVPAAAAGAFDRHFPTWTQHTIAEAGHWLHAEARDRFVTMVRDALS